MGPTVCDVVYFIFRIYGHVVSKQHETRMVRYLESGGRFIFSKGKQRSNGFLNAFLDRFQWLESSNRIFCRVGNTSVVLLPTSSCSAGAIRGTNSLDR